MTSRQPLQVFSPSFVPKQQSTSNNVPLNERKPLYLVTGLPGAGTSTLASRIASQLSLELVQPDRLVNEVMADKNGALFKEWHSLLSSGNLVDHELIWKLVDKKLQEDFAFKGCVVDGSIFYLSDPNTIMGRLKNILTENSNVVPILVSLEASEENLARRRSIQFIDPTTGQSYPGSQVFASRLFHLAQNEEDQENENGRDNNAADDDDDLDDDVEQGAYIDLTELEKIDLLTPKPKKEKTADGEEEEEVEEDNEKRDELRRRLRRLKKYATLVEKEEALAGKGVYETIPKDVLDKIVRRSEDTPELIQQSFRQYDSIASAINEFRQALPEQAVVSIQAIQNQDAVFKQFASWYENVAHHLHSPTILPYRITQQDPHWKGYAVEDLLPLLCGAQLPEGLPKRELSIWHQKCPVTYFESKTLTDGVSACAVSYKGYMYLCANETVMTKFLANPDKYLRTEPALTGINLCILGAPFTGKTSLANYLANKYTLRVISVDSVLQKWDESEEERELQKKIPVFTKITKRLKQGKPLSTDLYIELIKHLMSSESPDTKGWVLDGFPRTFDQAQQLVEAGVIPEYAIVLQPDVSGEQIATRVANLYAKSSSALPLEPNQAYKDSPILPESKKNAIDLAVHMYPHLPSMLKAFKEEALEIAKVLEGEGVNVVNLQADLPLTTLFSMSATEIDPYLSKAVAHTVLEGEKYIPFGLTKDYCPVTLRQRNILLRGLRNLAMKYKGKVYFFANDDAKAAFQREPQTFAEIQEIKIPPARFLFVGPPASGKTTCIQAVNKTNVPHVQFEKLVHDLIAKSSADRAKDILTALTNRQPFLAQEVLDALAPLYNAEPYATQGFFLEGFPRNRYDIESFIRGNLNVDMLVYLRTDSETCVRRILQNDEFKNNANASEELHDILADRCEKETSSLMDAMKTLETYPNLLTATIGTERNIRYVFSTLQRHLRQFLECRSSMLTSVQTISQRKLEVFLKEGSVQQTAYGKLCPVEFNQGRLLQKQATGSKPALINSSVVYTRNKTAESEFVVDTNSFSVTNMLPPLVKPRICVIGPPLSGKTAVAKRVALDLDLLFLDVPTILHEIVQTHSEDTEIGNKVANALKRGDEVGSEDIISAIKFITSKLRAQTKGWILDGFPRTKSEMDLMIQNGMLPHKIFETEASADLINSRYNSENASKPAFLAENISSLALNQSWNNLYVQNIGALRDSITKVYPSIWKNVTENKSRWWMSKFVRDEIMLCTKAIQNYQRSLQLNGTAAPCFNVALTEKYLQDNIGSYKSYCPVSLVDDGTLITVSDFVYAAQYKSKIYQMNGQKELDKFLSNPKWYVEDHSLPENLPHRRTQAEVKAMFPKQLEFNGFCPVALKEGFHEFGNFVPGEPHLLVEFASKLYTFASEDYLASFMKLPRFYAEQEIKQLPPKRLHTPLVGLPVVGYIEQTLSVTLNQALSDLTTFKPKYPFKNLSESANDYIAMYLKAHNPKLKDYVRFDYQKRLEKFRGDCSLLKDLSVAIRNQQFPKDRQVEETLEKVLQLKPPGH